MSKKKLIETHGKDDSATEVTMMDQLWGGGDELLKYGTLSFADYSEKVDEMNRPALEEHARKLGLIVVEDTRRLKESLKKEFTHFINHLRKPAPTPIKPHDISDTAKKILAEGR
jgi:hypothetical protein